MQRHAPAVAIASGLATPGAGCRLSTSPASSLHLSIPEDGAIDIGLHPAGLRVYPDFSLDAVVLEVDEADLQLVLSVASAISAILKMVGAVERLTREAAP